MGKPKYYVNGYGCFEMRSWSELKDRQIRYICTDYEEVESGLDLFEINDPNADDFGECYVTQITA